MFNSYKELDRICQDLYEVLPTFRKKHKKFYQKYDEETVLLLKIKNSGINVKIEHDYVTISDYKCLLNINFNSHDFFNEYAMPEYDQISYSTKKSYDFILRENNGMDDLVEKDITATYNPVSRMLTSDYLNDSKEIISLDCCKELLFQMSLEYDNLIEPDELWAIISSYRKLDTLNFSFRFENGQELNKIPDLKTVLVMP